jgi:hypothetical protein
MENAAYIKRARELEEELHTMLLTQIEESAPAPQQHHEG